MSNNSQLDRMVLEYEATKEATGDMKQAMQAALATIKPPSMPVGAADDFVSHRDAWREALNLAVRNAKDADDARYWMHEVRVFDKAYAALAQQPAAVDGASLTDAAIVAGWEAKAKVIEAEDTFEGALKAWQLRDCANELRSRATLAAQPGGSDNDNQQGGA